MGFFDGLGRLLSGKPVFEPLPQAEQKDEQYSNDPSPQAGGATRTGLVDERGNKIVPQIEIAHVQSHRHGSDMTVTAWVTNRSDQRLRIDEVRMIKQRQQPHRELEPAAAHELTLYHGSLPKDEAEHSMLVTYRICANGDLFERRYRIEYYRENDGGILVDELHEDGVVRDI